VAHPPEQVTAVGHRHGRASLRTGVQRAPGRQAGGIDTDAEQGAGDLLGGVEEVIEGAGEVRSGDGGQRGVVVQ
jgi:hypothetical protein